jgi:hypothetical protein
VIAPTVSELRDHTNAITVLNVQGGHAILLMRDLVASLNRKVEHDMRLLIGTIESRRRSVCVALLVSGSLCCNLWANSKEAQGNDAASERALSNGHGQSPAADLDPVSR